MKLENSASPSEQESHEVSLVKALSLVLVRIDAFKTMARDFYYAVLYSRYRCPSCHGLPAAADAGMAQCQCGRIFDPTVTFQRCDGCGARLVKRIFHYACSKCGKVIPSKFLFDENIFNADYFRVRMEESRKRKQEKRRRIQKVLLESRSGVLQLDRLPSLDAIPGLEADLDAWMGSTRWEDLYLFRDADGFPMEEYRHMILAMIENGCVSFNALSPLHADRRIDRVRRFITLLFMRQDLEVDLRQQGSDILVTHYESDGEG